MADCTCHQRSGDSWDCPEHHAINPRFRETRRIIELVTNRVVTKQLVFKTLEKVDAEDAERSREFYRRLNEQELNDVG